MRLLAGGELASRAADQRLEPRDEPGPAPGLRPDAAHRDAELAGVPAITRLARAPRRIGQDAPAQHTARGLARSQRVPQRLPSAVPDVERAQLPSIDLHPAAHRLAAEGHGLDAEPGTSRV